MFLFLASHSRGVTQWDHPEYVRIFEEIQSLNTVKFAAYRTACKLRRLQTRLKCKSILDVDDVLHGWTHSAQRLVVFCHLVNKERTLKLKRGCTFSKIIYANT